MGIGRSDTAGMTFGWVNIEPVQGKAGQTEVSVKLLSHNVRLDRQITIDGVCGTNSACMVIEQTGVLEALRATDGILFDSTGEMLVVSKTEYLPLSAADGLLLDNTGSLINIKIN